MLSFLICYLVRVGYSQTLCFWGRTTSNTQINGAYAYSGQHNGYPYYTMAVSQPCSMDTQEIVMYYRTGWYYIADRLNAAMYWANCRNSNDPTTGTGACNNKWEIGGNIDHNIQYTSNPCPEWNCEEITTSFSIGHQCGSTFDIKIAANVYQANNGIYFYYKHKAGKYICNNAYEPECTADFVYAYSDDPWVELSIGSNTALNFESYGIQTIYCHGTTPSPTTVSPTTFVPTSVPTSTAPTSVAPTSTTTVPTTMPTTSVPTSTAPTTIPTSNPTTDTPTYTSIESSILSPTVSPTNINNEDQVHVTVDEFLTSISGKNMKSQESTAVIVTICIVISLLVMVAMVVMYMLYVLWNKRKRKRELTSMVARNIELTLTEKNNVKQGESNDELDNNIINSAQLISTAVKSTSDITSKDVDMLDDIEDMFNEGNGNDSDSDSDLFGDHASTQGKTLGNDTDTQGNTVGNEV